jgi:hypothetical protein
MFTHTSNSDAKTSSVPVCNKILRIFLKPHVIFAKARVKKSIHGTSLYRPIRQKLMDLAVVGTVTTKLDETAKTLKEVAGPM